MKTTFSLLCGLLLPVCAALVRADVCVTNAPYNAKGDGVTDDTAAITNAIAHVGTNDTLYFPPLTYLINSKTALVLHSNMRVNLGGATIITTNWNSVYCRVFWIPNTTPATHDVQIYNGTILGSKTGTPTYAIGIAVDNAADITLQDLVLKNFYTDGIYIGGNPYPQGSSGVRVRRCIIDNVGRNSTSFVAGYDVSYEDCVFRNSQAPPSFGPYAGIDVEPNSNCVAFGMVVRGCTFTGNSGSGIYLHPGGGALGWGDITITGCLFDRNQQAGIIGSQGANCIISGNRILNHTNLTYAGIYLSLSSNAVVTANQLENNGRGVYLDRICNAVVQDNSVLAGTLTNVTYGVQFHGIVPPSPVVNDVSLADNIIAGYNQGIYAQYGVRLAITGNKILNCQKNAIYLDVSETDSLVSGNTFSSNGLAGTYVPLSVFSSTTNAIIGNIFRGNTGTTNIYTFANPNANRVIHNDFGGSLLPNGLAATVTNFDNGGKNWNR